MLDVDLSCPAVWEGKDFSQCFRLLYLQSLGPLCYVAISLIACAFIRRSPASHQDWWRSKCGIDIGSSLGLVGLNVIDWYYTRKAAAAFLAVTWAYVLLLSVLGAYQRWLSRPSQGLFYIIAVWHSYYWFIAGINLRTAYLAGTHIMLVLASIIFAVSTILFLSTLSIPQPYEQPVTDKQPSLELGASFWQQATFSWVDPLVRSGYRKSHTMSTVPDLIIDDTAVRALKRYRDFLQRRGKRKMIWSLLIYFAPQLLLQGAWAILHACLVFAAPSFLRLLLQEISKRGDPTQTEDDGLGLLYVLGLSIGTCLASVAQGQALFVGRRIAVHVRAIIIGEVFDKALRRKDLTVSKSAEESSTTGKIVNLVAVDAFKVAEVGAYIHYVWAELPLIIALAIVSLYLLLGPSALAAVVVMIISSPFNYTVSWLFAKIQRQLLAFADKRVNMTNEILGNIRIVKFFAWEERFKKQVGIVRADELRTLRKRFVLWAAGSVLWSGIGPMVAVAVFSTYTLLARQELTATKAFTSLSLLSIMRSPFDQLIEMISQVLQAKVSIDRVDSFMQEEETEKYNVVVSQPTGDEPLIGFSNAAFCYSDEADAFSLQNLSFQFPPVGLSLIVGRTGSGKTSMLMALLGELKCKQGKSYLPSPKTRESSAALVESVAYAAQSPWLLSASVRENILFGSQYDPARYRSVLAACALLPDLAVFPNGDATEVGERGVTMSGGQKARISLARAVYSDSRYLLLDDILSAVDAHTAKHLHKEILSGPLLQERCCILVTHAVGLCARDAKFIVVMDAGEVIAQGNYDSLLPLGVLGNDINEADLAQNQEDAKEEDKTESSYSATANDAKLVKDEHKAEGSVDWQYYKLYLGALGTFPFWLTLFVLYILVQSLDVGAQSWLRIWSSTYQTRIHVVHTDLWSSASYCSNGLTQIWNMPSLNGHGVGFYLGIYALISALFILMNFARNLISFFGSLRASRMLYSQLLDSVLGARVRFFDETPLGRLMNRFSKDIQTIDQEMATILILFIAQAVGCIAILLVISYATPPFIGAAVVIIGLYWFIAVFYLASSRELKRLESVNLSPIYSGFGETLQGVATVRAYSDEQRFRALNLSRIDVANRAFWWLWACNRWLSIRIDFAGALISLTAGIFVLYNRSIDAGLAGLSLTYAISWTNYVLWVVRLYSQCELNLNSVERVAEYLEVEQEGIAGPQKHPPAAWPTDTGSIHVSKLVVRYSKDLPPVLKSISFECKPREKIGIVGRTGSGKSTLALSFFRFIEPQSGTIYIDGIDISTLELKDLRSRISIIPQDAILFQGTIRSNLDPFDQYEDHEIWEALRRTQLVGVRSHGPSHNTSALPSRTGSSSDLKTRIQLTHSNGNKSSSDGASHHSMETSTISSLEQSVSESGKNFSTGQRQLLALARGLLQNNKILILDEATASLDRQTDKAIQETLRSEFQDCVMLTIAHRIKTVIDYDRILVLEHGEITEFDQPWKLMEDKDSLFRAMCERSGDWEQLQELCREAKKTKAVR